MKKILLFFVMAITVMACNETDTSISVKKTQDRYELSAAYPKKRDVNVIKVLKAAFLAKDSLLLNKSLSSGKEITLANGAVFYLRYNPGKLEMEMLLEKNNTTGLRFFDKMTADVKSALH